MECSGPLGKENGFDTCRCVDEERLLLKYGPL
jgi:hypothetical protein